MREKRKKMKKTGNFEKFARSRPVLIGILTVIFSLNFGLNVATHHVKQHAI